MRSFYLAFLLGLLAVVSVGSLVKYSFASDAAPSEENSKGDKVVRTEDKELSGLKAPVALSNEVAESLQKKQDELAIKEKRLSEREEILNVEEERLKLRIDELQKMQAEYSELEVKKSEEDKKALARTVKTYETMSPKKAAQVLTLMQPDLAVKILQEMKEKKLATILDSMNPEDANRISTALATRKPASRAAEPKQIAPESNQEVRP